MVSTSPCGGDIPDSNPGTRNLRPYYITSIDVDYFVDVLREVALSYTVSTAIQKDRK